MDKLIDGIVRSDAYLKTLFENGDKPTEDDFADLIQSKAHKKEVFLKTDEVTTDEIDELMSQLLTSSMDKEPPSNNKPSQNTPRCEMSGNSSRATSKKNKKKVKVMIKK